MFGDDIHGKEDDRAIMSYTVHCLFLRSRIQRSLVS